MLYTNSDSSTPSTLDSNVNKQTVTKKPAAISRNVLFKALNDQWKGNTSAPPSSTRRRWKKWNLNELPSLEENNREERPVDDELPAEWPRIVTSVKTNEKR